MNTCKKCGKKMNPVEAMLGGVCGPCCEVSFSIGSEKMKEETKKLMAIINSIKAGVVEDAHDDAGLLENVIVQREIQLNLQLNRPLSAIAAADRAIGK